jgi:hypothetical protein
MRIAEGCAFRPMRERASVSASRQGGDLSYVESGAPALN